MSEPDLWSVLSVGDVLGQAKDDEIDGQATLVLPNEPRRLFGRDGPVESPEDVCLGSMVRVIFYTVRDQDAYQDGKIDQ